jgi:hypothetical protein
MSPILVDALDRSAAATYIGHQPSTLASWANSGKHRDLLPFALIGKRCYYRRADLDRFLEAQFQPVGTDAPVESNGNRRPARRGRKPRAR